MPVPPLPVELVDPIVRLAIEDDPAEPNFTRNSDLLSFCLVNSTWFAISSPLLL